MIVDLENYKEDYMFINDNYCNADIYSLINLLEIEENSIISRYCIGIKTVKFDFNLKDQLELKAYEDDNIQEKIEFVNFLDLDFLEISEKLNKWIDKNVISFKRNDDLKIDISKSILKIFPYSVITKNEIYIIK